MVGRAVTAVPVSDDEVAARLLEQEEAEILGSHRGLELLHVAGAHEAAEELARELRLPGVVHGGGVVAAERELAARLEGLGCGLRNLAHPPLDQIQHGHGEGPDGPLQLARVRHDVDGFSGPDHGDRDDAGVDRALVARDDGLECLHHLSGHRHRVDAVVRHGRVRAPATDRDPEVVARGEHRPFLQRKLTGLEARPVVHAEDGFHRKEIEQPVLDHLARAAPALLGGLKDEVHGAVEVALAREIARGGEQHRGVPVMPAGVHLPSMNARVSEAVPLGHGQRVDVGAQTHGPRGAPVPHDADDPSPAEAPMHGDAPARERAGDEIGGPLLLEAELGVCVKVPPQRLD